MRTIKLELDNDSWFCWIRSAYSRSSNIVGCVTPDGSAFYCNFEGKAGLSPICII